MGHRVTQRVFQCDVCGTTPDDGEYLWEMGREHWCEDCCDKDSEDVMGESDGRIFSLGKLKLMLLGINILN